MVFALVRNDFEAWVQAAVEDINRIFPTEQRLFIQLYPEIGKAFQQSTAVIIKYKSV